MCDAAHSANVPSVVAVTVSASSLRTPSLTPTWRLRAPFFVFDVSNLPGDLPVPDVRLPLRCSWQPKSRFLDMLVCYRGFETFLRIATSKALRRPRLTALMPAREGRARFLPMSPERHSST
jgi:hypothetical protein